ncbi:enoyl-CoA hydratase/isomerase family protein [bacterium]|nr:enoyl-CoA hydratase/isomerase family protein [bacterium]
MESISKNLALTLENDIAWITIHRPQDRNSINSQLMNDLEKQLELVEKTESHAIVFLGGGTDHFIGGADGIEMMQAATEEANAFSKKIQGLFHRMETSPLILVAAIDGLCFGGGYEFALACDFRIATERSRIGLPEVKVGIIPGGGGTQRLTRLVGVGKATEIILGGRLYSGIEAKELGLIHKLAPDTEMLQKEVLDLLKPILKNPQTALSNAKLAIRASQYYGLEEGLDREAQLFSNCFKNNTFRRLMVEQLKKGILKTSSDINELLEKWDN